MKVVGIVIDVDGKYFAKDKDGNVRRLKVGDKVYEGESVYGVNSDDRIVLESPQNDKIILFGLDEFQASVFGDTISDPELNFTTTPQSEELKHTTKVSSDTSFSQPTQIEAIGFQEVFLSRNGEIINVEASLIDADKSTENIDDERRVDVLPYNPAPTLATTPSTVEDDFYDTPSHGVNSVENSLTFETLSGLKTLQIGSEIFTKAEVEAFESTPVSIVMQAGTIVLDGYIKVDNSYVISYTYSTADNYIHDVGSDVFVDSLVVIITDIGGQEAQSTLSINVIDDTPTTKEDTNTIEEGRLIDAVSGNVFDNDHIGADDETKSTPVVSIVSSIDTTVDGTQNIGKVLIGEFGSLTLNADGTYIYNLDETNSTVVALADGDTLVDTFMYIIEDGDKDSATNKLLITINGTSAPTVITQDGTVDDNFYDTYQASGTNEVNDEIKISLGGDIKTVEIAGMSFSQSDLEAFNTTPVTITMSAGALTLNAYSQAGDNHSIAYNYITSDNYLHDSSSDNFKDSVQVIVTDGAGRNAITELVINVVDDTPTTQDDTNNLQEGLSLHQIIGNVFLGDSNGGVADHIGADDANKNIPVVEVTSVTMGLTGVIGTGLDGKYGELVLKADGSYRYILDNTNIDVKALVDGEFLHDKFTYTIADSDGDESSASLDITIEGNSQDPVLIVEDGSVYESALDVDGTDPSSPNEVVTGKIIGTANDGFQDLVFTTSNGNTLTINDLSLIDGSQTVTTLYGTLTLTDFVQTPHIGGSGAQIGVVSYSYKLTDPVSNNTVSDSFNDVISVSVSDVNGDTTTEPLTITIKDDKPIATNDLNMISEDAASNVVSGNVLSNDNDGADTNLAPITPQNIAGQYGDFVLNNDGSYTYTLDNDNPVLDALNTGETLVDTLVYTITDEDGDKTTAELKITINGFTDPNLSVADVTVVEDGENSGDFKVTFTINMDTTSLRDVTFDYTTVDGTGLDGKEYDALSGTATIVAGATTATVTVTLGADDYVADSGKTFDLKITNVNTAGFILDATGTATITDDSLPGTPYVSGDGAAGEIENSQETVFLKLIGLDFNKVDVGLTNNVIEGLKAFYKVVVVDASGNLVVDKDGNLASGTVNIEKADGTALAINPIPGLDGDYDGTSPVLVPVNTVFSVATTQDPYKDSPEDFSVAIVTYDSADAANTSYSNASDYENVVHDTTPVVTTITDGPITVIATTLDLSGDTTVNEGSLATYTLFLRDAPEDDFTVEVTITGITADGSDVVLGTQNITISAGTTTKNFTVTTIDDTIYEGNEDFKVAITDYPTTEFEALTIINNKVITSIIDDDTPQITIDDITVQEDGTALLTVTSDIVAQNDMVFTYTTKDTGSATDAKDFTTKTGTVTILAGDTTAQITIDNVIDDYFADDSETFEVILTTNDTAVTIVDGTGVVTIDDNTGATTDEVNIDTVTLKLITTDINGTPLADDTKNTVDEGYKAYYKVVFTDGSGNILDELGNIASGNINIAYTDGSVSGEASGGDGTNSNVDDYVNTLTTVEINKVFSVTAVNDNINEVPDEKFEVNIVDGTYVNAGDYESIIYNTSKVETTIVNNTATPVYVHLVGDASVSEADNALLTHTIELRDGLGNLVNLDTGKQIIVNLTYTNNTTENADFLTKITQVNIVGNGGATYNFSNIVADDFLKEGTESYTLSIDSVVDDNTPAFYEDLVKARDTVTGTINDEATPDNALISITADQIIKEGDFSHDFIVSVDQPSSDVSSDITVELLYSGVAIDGTDFIGVSQVIIVAGTNFTDFSISTINDKLVEGSENFTITIGTITDTNFESTIADSTANSVLNTIIDDVDANPDTNALLEGGNQVTGNLLTNDEVGVNAKVTTFIYTDEGGNIQTGVVDVEADTQYGRITVHENGNYEYFSDSQENHPSDGDTTTAILPDIINYTIKDDNNDVSSATLTVNVGDTIGSIVDGPATSVNEDDLSSGSDTTKESLIVHGDLGIAKGPDDVANVVFDRNEVQTALSDLKSGGIALTYTLSANAEVLTAKAGTKEIFTITLNQASGGSSYDFELQGQLDHLNTSGGKLDSLDIVVPFRYKEQGSTEDVVKGNLTVTVVDDVPTAVVDTEVTVVEGTLAPITGNVLTNDIQGADGAQLHDIKYTDTSGTLTNVYFSDTVSTYTVDTPTGMLTVNQDGSWSFTAHNYVDHDDDVEGDAPFSHDGSDNDSIKGSFDYRLQDFDTDNSNYVTQVIHVTDGMNPTVQGGGGSVDEDDIVGSGSDQTQSTTVTGSLNVTTGSDPVEIKLTTTNSGTLTSDGIAVTYTLSADGYTLTGKAGSLEIFVATITDPLNTTDTGFSFELKGPIDHDNTAGENTKVINLVFEGTDIDGDSVIGPLDITVTDDIPSIGTPDDGLTDEEGLPNGSAVDASLTVTTGSLAVLTEADNFDTFFDQTTIDTLIAKGIQADNPKVDVTYVLSNNGHTLRASVPDFDVFEVTIIDPTSTNASYEFNLLGAIDHQAAGVTETFVFDFKVKDADGDETSSSFDVGIIDDDGTGPKNLVVNEDGSITFGFTADAMSASDFVSTHGKVTFDSGANKFTYTPDGDYSGLDVFDLTYSLGATSITETVNVTVNPISDLPLVSYDGQDIDVDEDEAIAIGFNVPKVKDDFDNNTLDTAPNSSNGDNPERLGAITISLVPDGAKLYYGSNVIDMDGSDIIIWINDLDNNNDGVNDHIKDVNTITDIIEMTSAEFESMQIRPPLNSGDNFKVRMKVTEYEVDDNGDKLSGVSGRESVRTVRVDVHAKTDDGVAISVADVNGDEDNWIRIDDAITITKTLDVDGSEVYELVFDGANLPSGTLYHEGALTLPNDNRSIGVDASSGFSINIPDIDDFIAGNYPIYIMTPINDSSDVHNLKVTVNVHDTDSDSTPSTDVVKSASDFVDVTVVPIANDITVSTSGSEGDEDTKIAINLSFDNQDGTLATPAGLEKVTSITIDGIPTGAKLFDQNDQEVTITGGSITIATPTGDTSFVEQYTILPPAHSSADITLQVSMTTKDFDDDGSANTDTFTTLPVDILVKINPVSETESTDTNSDGSNDIVNIIAHDYVARAEEDTYFNLNTADAGLSYTLEAFNEDAKTNVDGATNPNGNEETFVIFTNVRYFNAATEISVTGDTFVKYNDGSKDIELSFSGTDEVKIPLEFLDTVEIKSAQDFSGTFKVDTYVQNQDLGDDANDTAGALESSSISTLVIDVNPVIDQDPTITVTNLSGSEDAGRRTDGSIDLISVSSGIALKGAIKSADIDASEHFTIFIDALPQDAALYYRGHIIYITSANDFSSDGIIATDNGDSTFKVEIQELDKGVFPVLIPPHNSNEDITIKISGFAVDTTILEDGTVVKVEGAESTPLDINVALTGLADQVVHTTLKTFNIEVSPEQANGDKFIVTQEYDGKGSYNKIVQEDSDVSGVGVKIDLQDIYTHPDLIDSYDNIASNDIDTSPVADTSVATERVNFTVKGLEADFDLEGAVLVSGTGADRIFTFTLTDLQAGNIKVIIPEHYSGEVDLKVQYITTENDGDSKTSNFDDIKILVTPSAEDIASIALDPLEINEDVLTPLTYTFSNALPDDNGNPEILHEVWILKSDVSGKTFTLFYNDGSSSYVNIDDAVIASVDISDDGTYYHFENGTFNSLAVQYDADLGTGLDTINVKYTFMDFIIVDGKTIENISNEASSTYDFTLNPITDDIDAKATSIVDDDGDANVDIQDESIDSNGNVSLKVLDNTTLKILINIDGVDTANEIDITSPADTTNDPDYDASEKIISLRIDGVPKGIAIEGGHYAGDKDLDGDGVSEYSGIWYLDNPQDANGGDLLIDGTATYELILNVEGTIKYNDPNYLEQEVGATISVSFENQDGGAGIQTDIVQIVIDDSLYNPTEVPLIPMDIISWDTIGNTDVIIEDTSIALGSIVNFVVVEMDGTNTNPNFDVAPVDGNDDVITSDKFSITIEGLENATVSGWTKDTHGGEFWTFHGEGNSADIQNALDSLIITPNQDYNKNHDTAQGDTTVTFDEGPLQFTTTLTTYAGNGYSDTQSLNYSGNVTPVTDDITLDETFDFVDEDDTTHSPTVANEDGTFNIDINITSVDDPYLTVTSTNVTITNSSPVNSGVIVADGSNENVDGQISWDNGANWSVLNTGDSVDVPIGDINNVVFKLNQDIAGHVKLDYSVEVQEKDSTNPRTVVDSVEFDVKPVADGLDTSSGVKIVGDEDTFMELTDNSGTSFSSLILVDPTEELSSLVLEGVPNGYLVYVGATGSQVLANNLGDDGSGNNSWSIDVTGSVPQIWLRAPEDIGGVSSTPPTANWSLVDSIKITTGVTDMGEQIFSTQDVSLTINAVADDISINAQNASGKEGDDISMVLNALVKDTDGSEKLVITLTGLGAFAVFKLNGVELDASSVTYAGDTYTIDDPQIDFDTIKRFTFTQNDFTGDRDIIVTVQAKEISNDDMSGAIGSGTMTVTVSQQDGTSGDDILLFDLKGNDGLTGDDTLVFGTDWNSVGIDFTSLDDALTKNVEALDLTEHGDHSITLNTTDTEAMTDSRNELLIESDAGDTITIENDGDNVWAQQGSSNIYESTNGALLTINGAGTIDDTSLNTTTGDDILGYNNTNVIDGDDGDDRLIIFGDLSVDFTKVKNVETIDLSVVGDHDLGILKLSDVLAITDSNKQLTIEGDNTSDKVRFETTDGWVQGTSDGTYTSYTNTNDATVTVKVNDNVDDQMI